MKSLLQRWVLPCVTALLCAACGQANSPGFSGSSSGNAPAGDDGSTGGGGDDASTFFQSDGGILVSDGGFIVSSDGAVVPISMVTSVDRCSMGAPSGLSTATVQALLAGGSPGSLRYLNPYSQTVFPRGLIAPTLMWDQGSASAGSAADWVYVHLKSKVFEYKGCLAPTAPGQVQLPQDVWNAAGAHASGASDPFTLSFTVIASGKVAGPISEPIVIAPATLKGSIYYNSYQSKLSGAMAGGAVLRVIPGQNAQLFLGQSGCTGCHAVSANGTRMVAAPFNPLGNGAGATYALTPQVTTNPTPLVANVQNGTFVGVYPDGSLYMGNSHPNGGFGGPRPGGPLATGPVNASLFETDTGNVVNGTGISTGAMMPTFSPDGTLLTFNDYALSNPDGGTATGPQALVTMSFNKSARTASQYKKVFQVSDTTKYPGWPFFLPDNRGLVFAIGSAADFSGSGAGIQCMAACTATGAPTSDLYLLDLMTGTSTILAKAVGFASPQDAASDKTYLPFDPADELHHNYYPTMSPVAAGGYFWIFFDSLRHYGNQGLERQLWGAAIDVATDGTYAIDRSHPPFYVTGQEPGTGNHRAFTALDPCVSNGTTCTTGVDCCGGFCTNGMCGVPKTPRCSNTDEICGPSHTSTACPPDGVCKCCDPRQQCINGFCGVPPVQ
jgi:hypothetical protein